MNEICDGFPDRVARANVAEACVLALSFRMPMVLDKLGNEVDTA